MASTDPNSTARVVGGFTWFSYKGKVVGYAQRVGFTSPQPVAQPVAVQPMNRKRPVEIVTPVAIGNGTLTLQLIEHWNAPVWSRLGFKANDLADIFAGQWEVDQSQLHGSVVVRGPKGGKNKRYLLRHFLGLKIVDVRDDEEDEITSMLLNKPVTFWYRKSVFSTAESGKAAQLYAGTPDAGNDAGSDAAASSVIGDPISD